MNHNQNNNKNTRNKSNNLKYVKDFFLKSNTKYLSSENNKQNLLHTNIINSINTQENIFKPYKTSTFKIDMKLKDKYKIYDSSDDSNTEICNFKNSYF